MWRRVTTARKSLLSSPTRIVLVLVTLAAVFAAGGVALASGNPPSTDPMLQTISHLPPQKAKALQKVYDHYNSGSAKNATPAAHGTPQLITSCPTTQMPPESIVTMAAPYDPNYAFGTEAQGVWQGKVYFVMGGSLRSDPTQGVITIEPLPLDTCAAQANHIAPTIITVKDAAHDGAISFTAISGAVITFTTADGHRGQFNFVTDAFLA